MAKKKKMSLLNKNLLQAMPKTFRKKSETNILYLKVQFTGSTVKLQNSYHCLDNNM